MVAADPFLLPTKKFPADISTADQQRLTQAITETVVNEVLPAYGAFADFIAADYAPHGRTALSVASLADGKQRYLNDIRSEPPSATYSPQIHEIGLKEIERIQTDMVSIARRQGFADLASFRESLKNNPQYKPPSAGDIVDVFRRYIAQMQPKMPELFTFLPGSPVTVEPMPDFHAANATQ